MSYIYKCDICGKDSAMSNVEFSSEPLELQVNTYDGKRMNISMSIIMEDAEDTANIDKMSALLNDILMKRTIENGGEDPSGKEDPNELFQDVVFDNLDAFVGEFKGKLSMVNNSVGLRLSTPNPFICDMCKREMAYKALTEGKTKTAVTSLYATDSLRMAPLDPNETVQDIIDAEKEMPLLLEEGTDSKIYCIGCGKELKRETKTGKCRQCYLNGLHKKTKNKPNDGKNA